MLLCCKVCAGFVVNATAIIPQTDEARRILLAESFRVCNRLLNIDFRLRWCVNGSHLSLCAVARFEVPREAHGHGPATRHEPQHPVAPTLQTRQAWSVSKKYTPASTARHLDHGELFRCGCRRKKKKAAAVLSASGLLFCWFLSLVRLSVLDSFIVQVVLGRTVIGTAYHRLHADILHLRDQT